MRNENFGDSVRNVFVLHPVCTRCGNPLQISYKKPDCTPTKQSFNDGITGACKVEHHLYIYPCSGCISQITEGPELVMRGIEIMKKQQS